MSREFITIAGQQETNTYVNRVRRASIPRFPFTPVPTSFSYETMMSDSDAGLEPSPVQNISAQYTKLKRYHQQILDRWTPHILQRWLATAGLLAVFMLRILIAQGVSSL
jgi:hypothetical protein